MFALQGSVLSENGHDIPGLAFAADNMVQSNCVRGYVEKRYKREFVEARTECSLPDGFLSDGKNSAGGWEWRPIGSLIPAR